METVVSSVLSLALQTHFVQGHSDTPQNTLIDNIFVEIGGRIFQQTIGMEISLLCFTTNRITSTFP